MAVLDPSLRSRSYGPAFLESLPRCGRTDSLEEVRAFFRRGGLPAEGRQLS